MYWLLAKYEAQRDDRYKCIANVLINHVTRAQAWLTEQLKVTNEEEQIRRLRAMTKPNLETAT